MRILSPHIILFHTKKILARNRSRPPNRLHLSHAVEPIPSLEWSVLVIEPHIPGVRVRVRKLYLTSDSVNSTTLALTWNHTQVLDNRYPVTSNGMIYWQYNAGDVRNVLPLNHTIVIVWCCLSFVQMSHTTESLLLPTLPKVYWTSVTCFNFYSVLLFQTTPIGYVRRQFNDFCAINVSARPCGKLVGLRIGQFDRYEMRLETYPIYLMLLYIWLCYQNQSMSSSFQVFLFITLNRMICNSDRIYRS